VLRDEGGSGAWNMAVDTSLARTAPTDRGILRIYAWDEPTMSFGRNQRARGRYDDGPGRTGLRVVRRPTGGREVIHDRELTYACVLPVRALGLRATYRAVNRALVVALRSLGVPAELATGTSEPLPPDAGPCFGEPAPDEVVVRGRKLVGSAQARIGDALLQHGSIPLRPPRRTPREFGSGGITLEEAAGRPISHDSLAMAVETALAASFGGAWERGAMDASTLSWAGELERRYASDAWTWRR
jgi:lipoyl(octanoyl) transferase